MADRFTARVLSVNVAVPRPDPGGADRVSGIDKRPAPHIDVFAPGPDYGDGSGVVGDVIGDSKHHGGAQKAVYAFAREELDFWWCELGRDGAGAEAAADSGAEPEAGAGASAGAGADSGVEPETGAFANGAFGENLTTVGLDLGELLINQRVRIGTAELEVSVVRQPCRTFAGWLGEKGWVKKFSERGLCGAYFRVAVPGRITAGDEIHLVGEPGHGVTMTTAFRAAQGDKDAAARVVAAECMPEMYHRRMVALIGG